MIPAYAMVIIEPDLRGHVFWYVQYFWCEVEWEGHDREIDEIHDKGCVEHKFQWTWLRRSCAEMLKGCDGIGVGCCSIIILDEQVELV